MRHIAGQGGQDGRGTAVQGANEFSGLRHGSAIAVGERNRASMDVWIFIRRSASLSNSGVGPAHPCVTCRMFRSSALPCCRAHVPAKIRVLRVFAACFSCQLRLLNTTGVVAREWSKKYGGLVKTVGPIGRERLYVFKPEALHKILVSDWMTYPRVSDSPCIFIKILLNVY